MGEAVPIGSLHVDPRARGERRPKLTTVKHVSRIASLMIGASVLLGWLVANADVFYADGIRYINQAKVIDQGAWSAVCFDRSITRSTLSPSSALTD